MTAFPSPQSRAVRAGIATDPAFGAVMPPVYLSTNFTFPAVGTSPAYDYTRSGNPTRDHLRDLLADLEGGAGCAVTSSGMSAIHLTLQLLEPEDLLVVNHDCYGGLHRLVQASAKKGAFKALFVDLSDGDSLSAAMDRGPAMVWIETPSNPLLRV
ncbi:MAG: PLP-dependent transferase, partial [Longimicrobiales bacterium]